MSTLFNYERTPFDILVKNLFTEGGAFNPLQRNLKIPHPVDVYEQKDGVTIDIACTGIPKEHIEILIQSNHLNVKYDRKKDPSSKKTETYYYKGIAKRSFDLAWKVDSKYALSEAEASFENGLLKITIPFSKGSQPKVLKIK